MNREVPRLFDGTKVADTQVVVLMGGLGTRLGCIGRPKSMVDVHGRPFFDYELCLLRRWGLHRFLFLVGYRADQIEAYYGDGHAYGIQVQYSHDGLELKGTGGALQQALPLLEDSFLLLYGDSFMDIDYQEVVYRYRLERATGKLALMTLLENENRLDRSNVIYEDGQLLLYDKDCHQGNMRYIDYGVLMLSKEVVVATEERGVFDLSRMLSKLSRKGKLAGLPVEKRFYEIGSKTALEEFTAYAEKRFLQPIPAVFLDRDGVINEFVMDESTEHMESPFLPEEFVYRESILSVLRWIQEQGWHLFVVTNQPAAAKGKTSLEHVYDLCHWMVADLRRQEIFVDEVAVCPHHPVGSDWTQAPFLVGQCSCRKPASGLLDGLMATYCINRDQSWMVGDSYTDIIAGHKAGVHTVFLGELKCDACHRLRDWKPDRIACSMEELRRVLEENVQGIH